MAVWQVALKPVEAPVQFLRRTFCASRLARAGLLLTFANVSAGGLGYAYQVLMGRLLIPEDYALFSAFAALIMFVASPLTAMFMVISRRVSVWYALGRHDVLRGNYWINHRNMGLVALFGVLVLIPLLPYIKTLIKSPNDLDVWILSGILAFYAVFTINNAFFQGRQRFGWLAVMTILPVVLKIVFSAFLVALGYGVSGALMGLLFSFLFSWLVGVKKAYENGSGNMDNSLSVIKTGEIGAVFPVLLANVAFAAMTQLDMVLVRWFFPPNEAGSYAAASVIGKAILYLPGGMVLALFPLVAENNGLGKSSAHMLKQAVFLTAGLCGLVAFTYWLLGDQIIDLLFGSRYYGAGELLRWYGFAVLPMSLVMVAEHFLIAKGRVLFTWLFLLMAPIQIFSILHWHRELWDVIVVMGCCSGGLVVIGYGLLWREYRAGLANVASPTP